MKSFAGAATLAVLALSVAGPRLHAQATDDATSDKAAAPAIPQTVSVSEVRIVRLSEIKGEVQMDRTTGRGFEPAFPNLPIIQHAKLRTGEGVAEVEFEDNSSLRLTPNTVVEFPVLGRSATGATLSTIHVLKGAVYVSLTNTRSKTAPSQFTLTFGSGPELQTLTLNPTSHLELSLSPARTTLAVFDGSVDVLHGGDTITVSKKKELVFDPANPAAPALLTKIEKGPFDDWDKTQADYHKNYANAAFGLGSAYGSSDLNYYGSFANLPGCGNAWRPYFASAGWSPFSNGLWAYYPSAGYSWVSPYPWGWTPFHSGSWQQCGASGWGWLPGGQWNGLSNAALVTGGSAFAGGGTLVNGQSGLTPIHPKPPTHAPGNPTLIPVNTRPLSVSRTTAPDTFVFNKDSAGLGVPRQAFGKLGGVSHDVARNGMYVAPIVAAPASVTSGPMSRTANASVGGPATAAHNNAIVNTIHPASNAGGGYHGGGNFPTLSGAPSSGGWSGNMHSNAPTSAPSAPTSAPSAPSAPASHR